MEQNATPIGLPMLRTACTNISIITNFGCNKNCWYCIWKDHPLKKEFSDINYKLLDEFLCTSNATKVSLSGGGDPLYNYFGNLKFWKYIINRTKEIGLRLDVHTREALPKQNFWRKHINRCSFSSDSLNEDREKLTYISWLTLLRIVHVVTQKTTFRMIDEYLDFQRKIGTGCQFTIKELVGFDDNGMYYKIKKYYPELFALDSGDYNIYFMPDNSIKTKFLDRGKNNHG